MNYLQLADLRVPVITTDQMKKVDLIAVERYGIQLIQMMENAGRNLAELAKRLLGNLFQKNHLFVAVGKGNNGGGGLVAARHLFNWGAKVTVLLPYEPLKGIVEIQRKIIEKLPIKRIIGDNALEFLKKTKDKTILDALIGYGLRGKPIGCIASIIEKINTLNTCNIT